MGSVTGSHRGVLNLRKRKRRKVENPIDPKKKEKSALVYQQRKEKKGEGVDFMCQIEGGK